MASSLLRIFLIAAICLVALVAAQSRDGESGEPRSRGVDDPKDDDARTMHDCDAHITECGVTDKVRVITRPGTTIRVLKEVTTTTTTHLPNITNVITKVDVRVVNDKIQGHCRETTVYTDPQPATVTEYVTVEEVKEIVSIINSTTTEISWVTEKTIEQCFINTGSRPVVSLYSAETATVKKSPVSESNSPAVTPVEDNNRETAPQQVVQEKKYSKNPPRDGFVQDLTGNYFRAMDQ